MMRFDNLVGYFLPDKMKQNTAHPKYHEFRVVASTMLIGLPFVILFPITLHLMDRPIAGFIVNVVLLIVTLFSMKYFGHYRIPMSTTALATYYIIYGWIIDSGMIYSSTICMLHMVLLAAIWADKKYGWYAVFINLAVFVLIYYKTIHTNLDNQVDPSLGGPLYALVMNSLITIFFGGFLAYLQIDQERDRNALKELQDHKITLLDRAVKKRTEQLNTMREAMATDFHDETGNMLSAINRQASVLKVKLGPYQQVQPIVDSIIQNSNSLYAASKDFLWHLNHDSDDPEELFNYLTAHGQYFYNQFDIAFSVVGDNCIEGQLAPSAALNIIYIFKEAMTNVAKHAKASEVFFGIECFPEQIIYWLQDNGSWKDKSDKDSHYGLNNMRKRCHRNDFDFSLSVGPTGTLIKVIVPTNITNAADV
ncbi:MAG: hypothetical protein EOO90_11290 [Pedobacter sp.]|nr:MAG: hypothetical protein EOO90_11290 [Pedobacter sp.]